ncbi:DUF1446 domain-containing protein [Kordiimonas sp. SCSIO 12603]|uniref:acyclic terpene utilization AtuA family protein n=1 Tax=Kordiimonas sp. SCSIO 12603 TaxID=2829596 RepID=UPI0021075F05|nr:acyclic terpene utilization AtuA family protein [Kordiimonas sp. SCSIO 12603]UTW58869.1 DUF1446 domain-containing protein [Kordiimonas sp. SCSIO 12603]
MTRPIYIGGASGFWGDTAMSTPQLLGSEKLDYIVYDYLAEITMSIMARARAKDASLGYAVDFVSVVMKQNLKTIAGKGVKVLSNAGGVNPEACGEAIRSLVAEMDLSLKVAVITGDDLLASARELSEDGYGEMFSDDPFPDPEKIASINAYIGAFPIAKALSEGADIVITGRCVDSAVTLGACIHEFGWNERDVDLLAAGSLAGHIIECGPQATGGNFTDWEDVANDLVNIGYPVAEVSSDGSMVITKPEDTGGKVSIGTVAEQMLYEIGDPQAYVLPDVVCDFSDVELEEIGVDRVAVSGARGRAATDTYKVCATYADGFRGGLLMSFYGIDAARKAQSFVDAAFARADKFLRLSNAGDYTEKSVEILGSESQYGDYGFGQDAREVVLKIGVKHPDMRAVGLLLKEATGLGLATPPGLSIFSSGRPKPSPVVRLFSFLLPKDKIAIEIDLEGEKIPYVPASAFEQTDAPIVEAPEVPDLSGETVDVPLIKLAWGRSGDKGNKANIGIIARRAEYMPYIWAALTEAEVKSRFCHFLEGDVERFYLPGSHSINFLLHDVLGGGGVASLRNDPQGKGYAQLLLSANVTIPKTLAESL